MARSVGLEIGPSVVRAAVVERGAGPGTFKLVAARESPYVSANPASLTQALTQLRQSLGITQPVVLGLPSTSTILSTVYPLIANPHRASLAVQFELQQLLPFDVNDVAWHFRWLPSTNGRTAKGPSNVQQGTGAVVAAMRRAVLDERLGCCRRAGLSVRAVSINALAALNAWDVQPPSARPARGMLLHVIDAQAVEWIVWMPTLIQVVPVSSTSVQALCEETIVTWRALCAQRPEFATNPVSILGPSLEIPELQTTLTAQLGVRVDVVNASQLATVGSASQQPERAVTAFGLALQGFGTARVNVNLLASFQSHDASRRIQRLTAWSSGVCVVAALGFGVSGMAEISHRRALVLQALERQEHLYQSLRPEVRVLLQREEHTLRRSRQLEALTTEGPVLTQMLAQIAEVLPDNVWLTKLECTKGDALEGLLEGRAKSFQDVTQLMDQLKVKADMTSVKPLSTTVTTDEVSGKEMIAFAVQLERKVVPSTPATDAGTPEQSMPVKTKAAVPSEETGKRPAEKPSKAPTPKTSPQKRPGSHRH